MAYLAEYTDTFGGEANYCWARRATVEAPPKGTPRRKARHLILRRARKALGLSGTRGRITADYGDEFHWVPYGCCTILMVRWDEAATS